MQTVIKRASAGILFFVLILCTLAGVFAPPFASRARAAAVASLYMSPAAGSYAVGDTFSVSLYVNTGGKSINAVEADLSFPSDKLQVVSPSSGKSFIQVWVVQPSFSNREGTLNFQGAIPTPGINTTAGLISTITFRVVNTGTATIRFLDTSRVLLNDGQGTDILSQTTDGIYDLTVPPPAGPDVVSPTNPDQTKWYQATTATFQWSAPTPATEGYSYMMSDAPVDVPDNVSEGTGTFVSYDNLSDGVHYFHIKALRGGVWGGVTNYAVHIDNTPPAAFVVDVSPSTYTSNPSPVVEFQTTDETSGIDHYEVKVIPLNPGPDQAKMETTPFFIEASSPYTQKFAVGDYDVVVRAYDIAGNFYQATQRISIVTPLLEVTTTGQGLRIGPYTLSWPWAGGIALIILLPLIFILWRLWKLHRETQQRLRDDITEHPAIAKQLEELRLMQKKYDEALKKLSVVLLLVLGAWAWWGTSAHVASAASAAGQTSLALSPPIISLSPDSISNDQVLYLGGWANLPNATVVINIERTETGETFSGTATTGADGNWFYSMPQLLDSGHYEAWAELKSGDVVSAPSARVNIAVAPTALQIGSARFNTEEVYLLLMLLAFAAVIILAIFIAYHAAGLKKKRARLAAAIHDAEESVRRGFAILHRDIEVELAAVAKAKLHGTLSDEEREREEKLLKDLQAVKGYLGKEIWKIEEEGKNI